MDITRDNITNDAEPLYDVPFDSDMLIFIANKLVNKGRGTDRAVIPLFDKSSVNEDDTVLAFKKAGCQDCCIVIKGSQIGFFGLRKSIGD